MAKFVQAQKTNNLVYVDKQGVLRYTRDNKEAAFFGVNYTTPFAHAYRAHKALGVDIEKAIQQDVYQLWRLGLDAFRVHVWDTEISDSAGNLLENDHLRLFDFLLAELKKRHIKTIITPIAFWGNGYPERDDPTPGFSRKFGKGRATVNDTAIRAQENYLQQFFKHVNPYTKLSYGNDPDVIAVELNNEPSHSNPKSGITQYINRLVNAVKSTGFNKPLFYNISQNPWCADAVTASNVVGYSFQWYPTGLVAGQELRGNYLPNVDKYHIPFDTIKAFAKKALMVYEFDAADLLQSNMYPAMARSYRQAGFQWATQFAYDPMAIAHVNTEYQTHYLNLAYTPGKAISMLIASEVFHRWPRLKKAGAYPADTVFDAFRVSYKQQLSEMNTAQQFYYSNTTQTKPVNPAALEHVAGVGQSPVVMYTGSGAYFLDKVEAGVWRLELMPDAIHIRDPFERASPKKVVTRIEWNTHTMRILLPDLGDNFSIKGNNYTATGNSFQIQPGIYLLSKSGKNAGNVSGEFVAPAATTGDMMIYHEPLSTVTAGKPFTIRALVAGIDTGQVMVQIGRNMIPARQAGNYFTAEVPAAMCTPGQLNYRIIARKGQEYVVFPGNIKGNPFAWDYYHNETCKTFVATAGSGVEIYNAVTDPGIVRNTLQYTFKDKLKGRLWESFDKLVIRARGQKIKVTLIDAGGVAMSTTINLNNPFSDVEVPLNDLQPDSSLLLPRPYPGFQPLWFKVAGTFNWKEAERIQVTSENNFEVASIWLQGQLIDQSKQSFNSNWEFTKDTTKNWQKVSLPHTANIEPVEKKAQQWQGTCYYRKTFTAPNAKHIALLFEAAMHEADIYLNGEHIFKHVGGYLPFYVDVTSKVKPNNTLLIKLNNEDNPLIPPGKPIKTLDFNYYSGIYRNAWLITKEETHITHDGVLVYPQEVTPQSATLFIKTSVANAQQSKIRATLKDKSGKTVATTFTQKMLVPSPHLWSPDDPYLYELTVEVLENGQTIDQETITTGIKKVRIENHALYLNDKKITIYGTNRHQDYPYVGNAVPDNAQYRDALKIKEAGFNFVRSSHYPQSPAFLQACDELGLMVMDAIPGWQYYGNDSFRVNSYQDIRDMIRRDRNHASIILWEASLNESGMKKEYMDKAHAIVHEELPFPGVYSAGWINESYDVFLPARQHAKAPDYWKKYNQSRPLLIAEYGDWEYYAQNAGFNQTAYKDLKAEERTSRQLRGFGEKRLLQQALNYQEAHNDNLYGKSLGDANWLMYDYNRGYADDIESSGIMDIFRLPKFSFYFYQSQAAKEPMVYIANYWQPNSSTAIKIYSNCEEVELFLNGKSIARQKPDKDQYSTNLKHPPFTFHLPSFTAGTLTAIGYIDQKKAAEHRRSTPGAPAAIQLRVDESNKPLSTCDLVFVYAEIVDKNGTVVHDATTPISFTVEGDAELVGENPRAAEAGAATILLKSGEKTGTITITASANGLGSGRLQRTVHTY